MSRPLKYKCTMYCDIKDCKRTECHRSVLFKDGRTIMVEPSIYNYYRSKEKMRAYRETRNNFVNF